MLGNHYLKNVVTLKYDESKCKGCKLCTWVCPQGVFVMKDKKAAMVQRDACMECGACMRNCAFGAIAVRAGVGCATGIMKGWLVGGEPTCDCSEDGKQSSTCC